jgi:biotin carboxyl carrier protein
MTFEIEIGDRTRVVVLEALAENGGDQAAATGGERFRATIDGVRHDVSVRSTDLGLSLVFDDGVSVDIATTETATGDWLVQLPHVDIVAAVDRRRRERSRPDVAAAAGVQRVTAPMPGRVIRVLVKTGDAVEVRQGLVVVEAMKMENELVSPKAGTVKDVLVAEGVSVEAGRLLVVVE